MSPSSRPMAARREQRDLQQQQQQRAPVPALPSGSDPSRQRLLVMIDGLAMCQAVLFNARVLKMFRTTQALQVLCFHECVAACLYILLALAQLAFLCLRQQQYHKLRGRVAAANRLLRLAIMAATAAVITPSIARNGALVVHAFRGDARAAAAAAAAAAGGAPAVVPAAAAAAGAAGAAARAAAAPDAASYQSLVRVALLAPVVYLTHTHFVVGFRHTLLLQLATLVCCSIIEAKRVCHVLALNPGVAAAAQAVCRRLADAARAGHQLLAWELLPPAGSAAAAAADDALCGDPLAAIMLINTWAQLLLVVLLPCTAVYHLEAALRQPPPQDQQQEGAGAQAAAAAAAAAAATPAAAPAAGAAAAAAVSGAGARRMPAAASTSAAAQLGAPHNARGAAPAERRRQHGEGQREAPRAAVPPVGGDALLHVEPAPVALSGGGWWSAAVRVGLLLAGVLACWCLAEAGIALLLRDSHRFVCTPQGSLVLRRV